MRRKRKKRRQAKLKLGSTPGQLSPSSIPKSSSGSQPKQEVGSSSSRDNNSASHVMPSKEYLKKRSSQKTIVLALLLCPCLSVILAPWPVSALSMGFTGEQANSTVIWTPNNESHMGSPRGEENDKQRSNRHQVSVRGVNIETPLMVGRLGQHVELLCHALGWFIGTNKANSSSRDANRLQDGAQHPDDKEHYLASLRNAQNGNSLQSMHDLNEDDLISLVFWYKDDNPSPIYTLDARQVELAPDKMMTDNLSSEGHNWEPRSVAAKLINNNKRLLAMAKHYPAPRSGLSLDVVSELPLIKLHIPSASSSDSGDYKCRVDFRRAPTVVQTMRLLVQVPISKLEINSQAPDVIVGDEQTKQTAASQASQGGQLELSCIALDGSPKPELSWLIKWPNEEHSKSDSFIEGHQLKAVTFIDETRIESMDLIGSELMKKSSSSCQRPAVSGSRLYLAPLSRRLNRALIGCRARQSLLGQPEGPSDSRAFSKMKADTENSQNANRVHNKTQKTKALEQHSIKSGHDNNSELGGSRQLTKWFELRMNLAPERIELVSPQTRLLRLAPGGWRAELSENEHVSFVCRSFGSSPPARLHWSWRPERNFTTKIQTDHSELFSSSRIELAPVSWFHHLTELTCTATNTHLTSTQTGTNLTSKVRLVVKFKPVVRLVELKPSQEASQKKPKPNGYQSSNRQLECLVQSNPPINQLVWLVNEQPLAKMIPPPSSETPTSASAPSDNENKGTQAELLNWRPVFLNLGPHRAPANYKLWSTMLMVSNLSKSNSEDNYKCLAINTIGEGQSARHRLDLQFLPTCAKELDELHSEHWPALSIDSGASIPCELDPTSGAPTLYSWSFVGIEQFVDLVEGIEQQGLEDMFHLSSSLLLKSQSLETSSTRLETKSGELKYADLTAGTKQLHQAHGLLLCRALNSVGWQERPCVRLLLPPGELAKPSADNCTLALQLDRFAKTFATGSQALSLSMDCREVSDKNHLIFQLLVSKRAPASVQDKNSPRRLLVLTGRLSPVRKVALSDLLDHFDNNEKTQNDQSTANALSSRPNGAEKSRKRIMTLAEQVKLVGELVFTIRASNLANTSEPHAILGSELPLDSLEIDRTHPESLDDEHDDTDLYQGREHELVPIGGQSENKPGPAQVLRSASQESLEESSPGTQLVRIQAPSIGRNGNSKSKSILHFAQEYETGITIAAICGTVVLSVLTLTLIVVILKARKTGHQDGPKIKQANLINQRKNVKLSYSERDKAACTSALDQVDEENSKHDWTIDRRTISSLELDSMGNFNGSRVNFLAAPVRVQKQPKLESSNQTGPVYAGPSLEPLDSGQLPLGCLIEDSMLDISGAKTETLYVIGPASGRLSSMKVEPRSVVEERSTGRQQQHSHQLLGYCSPSICNSSISQQSLTLTSDLGASYLPPDTAIGHLQCHHCELDERKQDNETDNTEKFNCSGKIDGGLRGSNMYLFSFL